MDSFHFISNVDDLIPSMLQNFCESWLFVTVLFICEFSTDLSLFLTSHNGLSIEEVFFYLFLFIFIFYYFLFYLFFFTKSQC